MRAVFFDSGPVISLTMSNLLWVLEPLKRRFGGDFFITQGVYHELVEKPLNVKKFEFEAIQVAKVVENGVLEFYPKRIQNVKLLDIANQCYTVRGRSLRIIHGTELDVLSLACGREAPAVVDERTIRLLVEDPEDLQELLEKRLHTTVEMEKENVKRFRKELGGVQIIRSAELVAAAFSLGLFDGLVPRMKKGREILLDAVLWAVKSDGCAVTKDEIEEIKEGVLKS